MVITTGTNYTLKHCFTGNIYISFWNTRHNSVATWPSLCDDYRSVRRRVARFPCCSQINFTTSFTVVKVTRHSKYSVCRMQHRICSREHRYTEFNVIVKVSRKYQACFSLLLADIIYRSSALILTSEYSSRFSSVIMTAAHTNACGEFSHQLWSSLAAWSAR